MTTLLSYEDVSFAYRAGEPVLEGLSLDVPAGQVVGLLGANGAGKTTLLHVALGMLRQDLTAPGTEVEVEIYGKRHKAVVQPDQPLWDPSNERITA